MLSLASCTLGWSNGLIPSAQPATAVANSEKKKIRPRSFAPAAVTRDRRVAGRGERLAPPPRGAGRARRRRAGARTRGRRRSAEASASGSSAIGRMPRPCLPVDSATSCSAHSPNDVERRVDHERQLVAAAQRELAERGAEPQARVAVGQLAVLRRHLRALEHRLDVDAGQRRRHDAERRQRRVAPADLGVGEEHVAEALALGQLAHRRAGVGDRDEVAPDRAAGRGSTRAARSARSSRPTSRRR